MHIHTFKCFLQQSDPTQEIILSTFPSRLKRISTTSVLTFITTLDLFKEVPAAAIIFHRIGGNFE